MELINTRINCDNEGCGHKIPIQTPEQFREYVDKRCPVCNGEIPLITQDDVEMFDAIYGFAGLMTEDMTDESPTVEVGIKIKDGKLKKLTVEDTQ